MPRKGIGESKVSRAKAMASSYQKKFSLNSTDEEYNE
jgi:hypothetical protein